MPTESFTIEEISILTDAAKSLGTQISHDCHEPYDVTVTSLIDKGDDTIQIYVEGGALIQYSKIFQSYGSDKYQYLVGYYLYLGDGGEPSLLRQVKIFTDLSEAITDSLNYVYKFILAMSGVDPKESKFKLDIDRNSISCAEEFDDKDWKAINLFLRRFKQQREERNENMFWSWEFDERNCHYLRIRSQFPWKSELLVKLTVDRTICNEKVYIVEEILKQDREQLQYRALHFEIEAALADIVFLFEAHIMQKLDREIYDYLDSVA